MLSLKSKTLLAGRRAPPEKSITPPMARPLARLVLTLKCRKWRCLRGVSAPVWKIQRSAAGRRSVELGQQHAGRRAPPPHRGESHCAVDTDILIPGVQYDLDISADPGKAAVGRI